MRMSISSAVLTPLLLAVLFLPVQADTGIPDLSKCTATSNPGCILVTPEQSGPTLASRGLTVSVVLRDAEDVPIANYPAQDIWLARDGGGNFFACYQGSLADQNTNAAGETQFSGALAGGGFTDSGLRVYVAGMAIGAAALPIDVVNPDLTGDLFVNMADLGTFAVDYGNGVYDFRSDLACDGVENLADIGVFVTHLAETCP